MGEYNKIVFDHAKTVKSRYILLGVIAIMAILPFTNLSAQMELWVELCLHIELQQLI